MQFRSTLVLAAFTLRCLPAADVPAPPAIERGGIWNAASHVPPSLAGGAIARGARFIVSGVRLGPEHPVTGSEADPPETLGDVSVRLAQGESIVNAKLLSAGAERIEGWIPPSARAGRTQLIVTYEGRASEPYELTLAESGFGFYAPETPPSAVVGESITLTGTGRGADELELFVGGKAATGVRYLAEAACCRGVDRVQFTVPAETPLGCAVPVQARSRATGRPSNVVAVALHAPGQPCHDEIDWFRERVEHAARAGFVAVARISAVIALADHPFDYAIGTFGRQESGQRPFPPFPPMHTCTGGTDRINLRELMGHARAPSAWTSIPKPTPGNRGLDAGATLSVSGPGGEKPVPQDPRKAGSYGVLLGGEAPFSHVPPVPLFAKPGAYTISAEGGADVGPFSVRLAVSRPIVWSNRAAINNVDRRAGFTVEWKASRKEDAILIAVASADGLTGDSAICFCMAPAKDGRFTIPPLALANLPASSQENDFEPSYVLLLELPVHLPTPIQARGLDAGFAAFISGSGRVAPVR
jgi:uncharacterized protein (TIGR03437 family)